MNHEDRVDLAHRITDRLLEEYGDKMLVGGIYGSTARGTDTEHSDLEMFFIVKSECKAKSFSFAYERMPVNVCVQRLAAVKKDINEIDFDWPWKIGRLLSLKITCGDEAVLARLRRLLEKIPDERFSDFISRETPMCYEGLGRLKAVMIRGNNHEIGLFVAEILMEFMLLIAIFNREPVNYDYLGGLPESFRFRHKPRDYEKIVTELVNWRALSIEEIVKLAERLVKNFVGYMSENGIEIREHTPVDRVDM